MMFFTAEKSPAVYVSYCWLFYTSFICLCVSVFTLHSPASCACVKVHLPVSDTAIESLAFATPAEMAVAKTAPETKTAEKRNTLPSNLLCHRRRQSDYEHIVRHTLLRLITNRTSKSTHKNAIRAATTKFR